MARTVPLWLDAPSTRFSPLEADEKVDAAIVGAGVTGLSCARILARAGLRVRVLEARRVGHGASGRNGGFALRGTALPYHHARLGDVTRLTEEALTRLREAAGDAFRPVGSLRVGVSDDEVASLRREHDALVADGFAVVWREREELPPALREHALAGLFHPPDGALEQGRWIRGLAELAYDAGADIAEETPVVALDGTCLGTTSGDVTAGQVVIATDGYTHGLVPELDEAIVSFRGQVLATAPVAKQLFPCPIYARWGFDYWQQLRDGRIVIGGRRDADLEGEVTRDEEPTELIQGHVEDLLRELLGKLPEVTHRWGGLMGFSRDDLPLVGPLPGRDGIWASVGYSGHGNVLGFACGELVGQAILGRPDERLTPFSPERILAARPPV